MRRLTNQRLTLWHLDQSEVGTLTTFSWSYRDKIKRVRSEPLWPIIQQLHRPHLRPLTKYRQEQWRMFSVISPPCLCSGNVFICENSWDHDNCLIMQSIVKSVSGPQFLVSSPSPFLQPPLTSFRVLIIGDTRKVNMSCYVKAKTRRGDPNHFIFFLFILIVRKKPFCLWSGDQLWSRHLVSLCVSRSFVFVWY